MGKFKAPKPAPLPEPPPPPPEPEPRKTNEAVRKARREEVKRVSSLRGDRSTLLTGPSGLMKEANTGTTTLLGG